MILEDYLRQNAELYPQKAAVICDDECCNYAELNRRVDEKVAMLNDDKGSIVCLRAECNIDFLVTYFALHRYGAVAAPMQRDIPEDSFREIEKELGRRLSRAKRGYMLAKAQRAASKVLGRY